MTRPSTPPILSELRSANSPASQVKALRQLKNDVIGHEQKKRYWVELGVLPSLVRILNSYKGDPKIRARNTDRVNGSIGRKETRTVEDNVRLQAIIVVGSLAHGGPAFIPSLHASHALPSLLALLSLGDSSPQVIIQSLRTLNSVADALCLSTAQHPTDSFFARHFYTHENQSNLANLLVATSNEETSTLFPGSVQATLIAALISKTCHEEYQRKVLTESGVLNALAIHLLSWVPPSIPVWNDGKGLRWEWRMPPESQKPSGRGRLSSLLHATGVIIHDSKSRAGGLLRTFDPTFQNADKQLRVAWDNLTANVPASIRGRIPPAPTSAECLAPAMPGSQTRDLASFRNLPPLDPIKATEVKSTRSLSTAIEIFSSNGLERITDEDNTFIAWLIHVSRTMDEVTGLTAMWMLAVLYRLNMVKNTRDASLALLTIPPLVRLLDKDLKIAGTASHPFDSGTLSSLDEFMKEEAPAVLAMLTINNPKTQKAAVDAGAVKKLAQLLKQSYDPIHTMPSSPMWSSRPADPHDCMDRDEFSKIGPAGVSSAVRHTMKIRETTLIAMAALASDKDEYRKAIIETGVISFIVRTLKAEDVKLATSEGSEVFDDDTVEQRINLINCKDTVLAACGATRALSRSVSTLRTNLMDAGLAAPLFKLVKCHDIEIRIAATAVLCNLVLEFSPMREAVLAGGILPVLCEHAHMNNASLRLNSLWALKHVVINASSKTKRDCVEGLGVSWLKQIITSDPEIPSTPSIFRTTERDDGNLTPIRMSTPNAAGEQVDLLNAVDDSRESSQAPEEDGDEDTKMSDSIGSLSKSDSSLKPRGISSRSRPSLTLSKPMDLPSELPDDAVIIKQGLEFFRNLMLGNNLDEMIDFVYQQIGQDEFFRIIASKMRPRVLNAFVGDRKTSENGRIRHIPPQPEILTSAIYCIVHIAAGNTRHKQDVIHQTKVLELIVPLLSHPDPEIRSSCTWVAHNLAWDNDSADRSSVRDRARRLSEMGFIEKLQELEKDPDLNCRERAKSTLDALGSHLSMR